MDTWQQTLGAGSLLGIAAAAIALILVLIIGLRLHAFLVLVLISALTAFATGIPVAHIPGVMIDGFGKTLAGVALLVGLGAMLGRLVETSGGAQALADSLIAKCGEHRAPFALGLASLLVGFPIFFDAGLMVMLPVVFAVARRLKGSVLLYGIPAVGAFSVMHVFVPPHPGPVAASALFGADLGVVLAAGLIIAFPLWYVSGYVLGTVLGKKFTLPVPDLLTGGTMDDDHIANPASPGTVVSILAIPPVLIFLNTATNAAAVAGHLEKDSMLVQATAFLGNTAVALLITTLVAAYVLGTRRGVSRTALEKTLDGALGPICSVVLITGAGGMFGGVLRTSGIGQAVADSMSGMGIPLILACFLVAVVLRLAQGSATVALTTSAALMAPAVAVAGYGSLQLAGVVLATAAGSVFASHVNDSGFWLVGRLMGMDVSTTLKTWTVNQTLIGVVGFLLSLAVFGVGALVA